MATDQLAPVDQGASLDDQILKDQKEKVRRLRKRLQARESFILAEVWDVVSARVIADAGFDSIGVSAASIAWSRGLHPHERLNLETLTFYTRAISRHFSMPIIADLECVIGRSVEDFGKAVEEVVSAGCVGVVIGDGGRGG